MAKISNISCRSLPEELIIEILLRLPVKSLMRLKTLAKYWHRVITSSHFVYNHLSTNHQGTRVLADQYIPGPFGYDFCFALLANQSVSHLDTHYLRLPRYINLILGPVNGLFLFGHGHNDIRLALLNPATREMKTIFIPETILNRGLYTCTCYGFGFDPLTKDYKVVGLWEISEEDVLVNMAVYSLQNDSWKHTRTKMHNITPPVDSIAPYINGECHWLLEDSNILSFNFGTEVLKNINGPLNVHPSMHIQPSILFIHNNETIGMLVGTYKNLSTHSLEFEIIEAFVMKEEGCWTKILTADVSDLSVTYAACVWNNQLVLEMIETPRESNNQTSDMILPQMTNMVLYDPTTRGVEKLLTQPQNNLFGFRQVFIYEESLVSPAGSGKSGSFTELLEDFCEYEYDIE